MEIWDYVYETIQDSSATILMLSAENTDKAAAAIKKIPEWLYCGKILIFG